MKFKSESQILKEVQNKPLPILYFHSENPDDINAQLHEKESVDLTCVENKQVKDKENNEILNETSFSKLKESLILFTTNELKNVQSELLCNQKSLTFSQNIFESPFDINYDNTLSNRCSNKQNLSGLLLCNRKNESCDVYQTNQNPVCCQDNDGFKIPITTLKRKINGGNLFDKICGVEPKTPVMTPKIECFLTPSRSLQISTPLCALTPFLMRLGRDSQSPNTPIVLSEEMFSTPAIVKATKPWKGAPDILSIIDDDLVTSSYIECKTETFDGKPLQDSSITDFVIELIEDYEAKQYSNIHASSSFVVHKSEPMKQQRGSHCKKLPQDIEEAIKLKQKAKSKKKGRKRKCHTTEDTEVLIKRRLNSCCRRTRSLVKAAEKIGLDVSNTNSQSKEE